MKAYTIEEAKEIFEARGLTLLETEYKDIFTSMECENEKGYKFYRSLKTVVDGKCFSENASHLFSRKNKFAWYNINHYMELEVSNGTKLISVESDYVNSDVKLSFICGSCGKEFKKRFLDFKHSERKVCNSCFKKSLSTEPLRKKNDISLYEEKAEQLGMKILSNQSPTYHGKIEVEDENGYRGYVTVAQMMRTDSVFEKFAVSNPYTIYNIRVLAKLNGYDCTIPDQKFVKDTAMMKFVCSCGREFETSLAHFIHDRKSRCNECRVKQSNIAKKVQDYLDFIDVSYTKEKTFAGCCGNTGKKLQFDFYLEQYNLCIEVDGIQHYKPIPFNGNKDEAKEQFLLVKRRDQLKDEYCKANNINLLRLPFWKIENSEEYKVEIKKYFPFECSELR